MHFTFHAIFTILILKSIWFLMQTWRYLVNISFNRIAPRYILIQSMSMSWSCDARAEIKSQNVLLREYRSEIYMFQIQHAWWLQAEQSIWLRAALLNVSFTRKLSGKLRNKIEGSLRETYFNSNSLILARDSVPTFMKFWYNKQSRTIAELKSREVYFGTKMFFIF